MTRLWHDCDGGILTTELLLVTSVLVGTMTAGLSGFRDAVTGEFSDVANSVSELSQSYRYPSVNGMGAYTAGSDYYDHRDGNSVAVNHCVVIGG